MTTAPSLLYYLDGASLPAFGSGTDAASATGATAVDAETLASGEVCYKLNEGATSEGEDSGDQTVINWYQTIGEDPYPVLDSSHGIVTFQDGIYTGIDDLNGQAIYKQGSTIVNLAGQRMVNGKCPRGIYIINGKKYIQR